MRYLVLIGLLLSAVSSEAGRVVVRLRNPPAEGTLALVLFDDANAFGDLRDPVRRAQYPVESEGGYILSDVPSGEYALLVYLDENANGGLDRNFIGIPVEPLAFSNGYHPKGPPRYDKAAFRVTGAETREFVLDLRRPLGKRGRIGVGAGLIGRSSPYEDADSVEWQPIPAITYVGSRLQILGPRLQFGLTGTGDLSLAIHASYRFGAYDESDSPALEGMGDREDTVLAGPALGYQLPAGVGLSLDYAHDVLGRIGGGTASLGIHKSYQAGVATLTPSLAVHWTGADLADHDYGIPKSKARPDRPAYRPGATVSWEAGLGSILELTDDWLVVVRVGVEFLGDDVRSSPIVEDGQVFQGLGVLNYTF